MTKAHLPRGALELIPMSLEEQSRLNLGGGKASRLIFSWCRLLSLSCEAENMRTCCPSCGSVAFKKNGINQYGDQNHKCLDCGKQFVLDPQQKLISEETRTLIRSLLLERLSLRGICRVTGVSKTWLLDFVKEAYSKTPSDLGSDKHVRLRQCEVQVGEMQGAAASEYPKQTTPLRGRRWRAA